VRMTGMGRHDHTNTLKHWSFGGFSSSRVARGTRTAVAPGPLEEASL